MGTLVTYEIILSQTNHEGPEIDSCDWNGTIVLTELV